MSKQINTPVAEDEIIDELDLEEWGKSGLKPPKARRYRIRIDKEHYIVEVPEMTGRQLLVLAGKTPPDRFTISQKLRGGQTATIPADGIANFTQPGVERFMTLPLDQTEG